MQSKLSEELVKLFLAYSDNLYDYAFYRTNDAQAAEDLVQTVFLLACQKIERIPPECRQSWLYSTMQNLIRTYYRKKAMAREVPLEDSKILDLAAYEMQIPETGELVFPPGLKPKYCEILQLRAIEQLGYDEIAKKLGISKITARQRFSRAVKAYLKLQGKEKIF